MTTYSKRKTIVVATTTPPHTNTSKIKNPKLASSTFEYKKVNLLRRYLNITGKIIPHYINCLSSKNHRIIVRSIKRARNIAQLPFVWVTYLYLNSIQKSNTPYGNQTNNIRF